MKLKEVLSVIDSVVLLEIADKKERYDSKSAIPEERMNHILKSIHPGNNNIIIVATEPPKAKTL